MMMKATHETCDLKVDQIDGNFRSVRSEIKTMFYGAAYAIFVVIQMVEVE